MASCITAPTRVHRVDPGYTGMDWDAPGSTRVHPYLHKFLEIPFHWGAGRGAGVPPQ